MQTNLEKQIIQEAKGLPESALDEVLLFIQFVKLKWTQKKSVSDNIALELKGLDANEWEHLDKEMKDYKKLFPHAK